VKPASETGMVTGFRVTDSMPVLRFGSRLHRGDEFR
jgi:hypothetical protein